MPLPEASADFYRTMQRLQLVVVMAGRRAWSRMRPDFDPAWTAIAPSLLTVTAAAQLAAARAATEYVPQVLAETDQPDRPDARVRPQAFAGVASDGRSLAGLLAGAPRLAKQASGRGMAPDAALDYGGKWLETALRTAVADAARDAAQTETFVREDMGYVRQINPPCCSRCAVLAGKWYRSNNIMPRHDSCDCQMIPSLENRAGDFTTSPQMLVERGLVTDLTKNQRARLDDGADLPKVLNESRDRWRERMASDRRVQRDAAKRTTWGSDTAPPVARTANDFMAHLTNRVDAINQMRAAGIVE